MFALSGTTVLADGEGRGEGRTSPLAERLLPADAPEARLLAEAGEWLLEQMMDDEGAATPGKVRGAWWREFDADPFTTTRFTETSRARCWR